MESINLKNEVISILVNHQESVTTGQHHDNEEKAVISGYYENVADSIIGLLKAIDEEKTIDFLYSKE